MSENFKVNFMIKNVAIDKIDYFTGKTIYTNNFKDILDIIISYYEKENERIFKLTVATNSDENYNVNITTLIDNYRLIPENFYKQEEYEQEYAELLMLDKLKRR